MIDFFKGDIVLSKGQYPYVLNINDDEDNRLVITIALTKEGDVNSSDGLIDDNILVNELIKSSTPIVVDDNNTYEIIFNEYIMYQVGNESYYYGYKKNNKYFDVVESSKLLDQLEEITICGVCSDGTYYPGKCKHYFISGTNHVVNVISTNAPIIKKIS